MGLHNNPTDKMAHEMTVLASYQEFQDISCFDVYKEKILNRDFSQSFLEVYDQFMYVYGSRGFGEIDVANMRNSENHENFYSTLKMINVTSKEDEKRQRYYEKLLSRAKNKNKKENFGNMLSGIKNYLAIGNGLSICLQYM